MIAHPALGPLVINLVALLVIYFFERRFSSWRRRTRICRERAEFYLAMRDYDEFNASLARWRFEIERGPLSKVEEGR